MNFATELKVPPSCEFLSLVETFALDAARRADLAPDRCQQLVEAARRSFEAIVRADCDETTAPVRIIASCSPVDLTLAFVEHGLPMDDESARRDPQWAALLAAVDAAHWRSHGKAGSELQLVVRRPHPDAGNAAAAAEPADVPPAPPQEYVVRSFRPSDAPGIARAFYLTYGYAYDFSAVYVPERLIELNQRGRYVSIVALTREGEVVGHYALMRDDGVPIADAGGAIVVPAHRGRDLLDRLRARAEQEAVALGLAAYYSEPVTDHGRTQHSSESFGAKACGVTLGEAPRSFIARHIKLSATAQRQSCMLYVKPLRPRERRTIYVPPHHRAIVAQIYDELGLEVDIAGGAQPHAGDGRFHAAVTRGDGIATIDVEAIGVPTAQRVAQAVQDLAEIRRLGAIYAALPLEDPGTPALCDALESYGFFFSGVGPWMLGGGDALRLQMPLTPIDLSVLTIVGTFGRRLVEYVGAERARVGPKRL